LNKADLLLSERVQRYVAKSMQGLEKRTRMDICNGLLGWIIIEGYIEMKKKLLYIVNICRLDNKLLLRGYLLQYCLCPTLMGKI
jgi:hypothetical protein